MECRSKWKEKERRSRPSPLLGQKRRRNAEVPEDVKKKREAGCGEHTLFYSRSFGKRGSFLPYLLYYCFVFNQPCHPIHFSSRDSNNNLIARLLYTGTMNECPERKREEGDLVNLIIFSFSGRARKHIISGVGKTAKRQTGCRENKI